MLLRNLLSVFVCLGFLFCPGYALAQNPDTIARIIREECENWLQPQEEITINALKNCYGKIRVRLHERSEGKNVLTEQEKIVFTDQEIQELFKWLPQATGPERLLAYDLIYEYSITWLPGEPATPQLKRMRSVQRELVRALKAEKSFRDSYYDFLLARGHVGGFNWAYGSVHLQDATIEKEKQTIANNVSKFKKEDELTLFFSSVQMFLLYQMLAFDDFFPNSLSDVPTQESVFQLMAEYRAWRKSFFGEFLVLDPWTAKICYRPGQAILSGFLGLAGILNGLCASPCRFRFDFFQAIVRDPIQLTEFGRIMNCYSEPYARSFKGFTAEESAVFKMLFSGTTMLGW